MNTSRLSIAACACLVLAVCVPFAGAQTTSLDIEAGYQQVDVNGNEDMFQTQINQQDGFVLRNFSINYVDPSGNAVAIILLLIPWITFAVAAIVLRRSGGLTAVLGQRTR